MAVTIVILMFIFFGTAAFCTALIVFNRNLVANGWDSGINTVKVEKVFFGTVLLGFLTFMVYMAL